LKDLFSGVGQKAHAMVCGEVSHEGHEHVDVSVWVKEVLVSQLLWIDVSDGLNVSTSAFAVLADSRVLDQVALFALEILHLVRDKSSIDNVQKSLLNVKLVHLMIASWVFASPVTDNFHIIFQSIDGHTFLLFIQIVISTDINI
jgi:hypothetical protein